MELRAILLLLLVTPCSIAQTTGTAPIGSLAPGLPGEVKVSGAVTLAGSGTMLGNGSTITAGANTLPIHLTRGGTLDLCATTELHLAEQNNAAGLDSPLLLALDRGAIEAHYTVGKNSDVVLTPDLRILLSGPGKADVRIRVGAQGDTCISNRGEDAPYVTASEQIGTGVYRVQAGQRVLFEHGSVRNVVDREDQPCGCPAPPVISVAAAGTAARTPESAAKPGQTAAPAQAAAPHETSGGPSSTPADTAFPLAESEGLAPAPPLPTAPVVPPGQVHAEVSTSLSYNAPQQSVPTGEPNGTATPESAATVATTPAPGFGPTVNTEPSVEAQAPAPAVPQSAAPPRPGIFHKLGRLFARIFG